MTPSLPPVDDRPSFLGPEPSARAMWSAVATLLDGPAAHGERSLLVFERDTFGLLVSLLAGVGAGQTVVLPRDHRRATLARLQAHVQQVVHDTRSGIPHTLADLLVHPPLHTTPEQARERVLAHWDDARFELEDDDGPILIFGHQLRAELTRCAAALSAPEDAVFGLIGPTGHRFGLVWGLLLPLWTGRRIHASLDPKPGELGVLVTTPGRRPAGPLAPLVVSGLASPRTPVDLDVFCTQRAGSVATRRGREGFELLGDVEAEAGARTALRIGPQSFELPDPSTEASGRLEFGPRADRQLSIGGRSLDPDEQAAALIDALELRDVVLHQAEGKLLVLTDGLTTPASLSQALDLPEEVIEHRSLSPLPRDPAGRLPRATALALFQRLPSGRPAQRELEWSGPREQEDAIVFDVHVPADLLWYQGHFSGYPVLPAAAQLTQLVLGAARRAGLELDGPAEWSRLKFSGRILPGHALQVHLRQPAEHRLDFQLRDGERVLTSGQMRHGGIAS